MSWDSKPPTPEELAAVSKPTSPDWTTTPPTPTELGQAPGMGESLVRGAANGATLGWEPSIAGGLEAAKDRITGENKDKSLLDLYRQYRDLERSKNEAAAKANPKTYLTGNIGGAAASSMLPGVGEYLAVNSLPDAAIQGGIAALGSSKADLTKSDPNEYLKAAKDTGLGMGVGAAAYPLGQYLSSKFSGTAVPHLADKAQEYQTKAGDKMLAALQVPKTVMKEELGNNMNILADPDYRSGMGQEALEHFGIGGGIRNFRDSITTKLADQLNQKKEILSQIQQGLVPYTATGNAPLQNTLESDLTNALNTNLGQVAKGEPNQGVIDSLRNNYQDYIQRIKGAGNDPEALDSIKQEITSRLGKNAGNVADREISNSEGISKDFASILKNRIEDLAEAAQPGLKDQLIGTNNTIGNLLGLSKVGVDSAAKANLANDWLGTMMAYSAGHAAGGPVGGMAAMAAKQGVHEVTGMGSKQLLNYGAAKAAESMARGARQAAKVAEYLPNYSGPTSVIPAAIDTAKSLVDSHQDDLAQVADKLNQNGFTHLGSALQNALQSGNTTQKNALIFSLSSNPQTRALLNPPTEDEAK